MTKKITIDKAGRVVIPKPLRKALHLNPGDSLQLDSAGDEITLRPMRLEVPLKKEQGIWVFRSGHSVKGASLPDLIEETREERSRDLLR